MSDEERRAIRQALRQTLRRARFEGWNLDDLEDEIETLFREGVPIQTPPPADQLPEPPPTPPAVA